MKTLALEMLSRYEENKHYLRKKDKNRRFIAEVREAELSYFGGSALGGSYPDLLKEKEDFQKRFGSLSLYEYLQKEKEVYLVEAFLPKTSAENYRMIQLRFIEKKPIMFILDEMFLSKSTYYRRFHEMLREFDEFLEQQ